MEFTTEDILEAFNKAWPAVAASKATEDYLQGFYHGMNFIANLQARKDNQPRE